MTQHRRTPAICNRPFPVQPWNFQSPPTKRSRRSPAGLWRPPSRRSLELRSMSHSLQLRHGFRQKETMLTNGCLYTRELRPTPYHWDMDLRISMRPESQPDQKLGPSGTRDLRPGREWREPGRKWSVRLLLKSRESPAASGSSLAIHDSS